MSTLYELTGTMKHLLDLAQSGEIEQETIDATIESMDLKTDVENKIESYVIVMDELKAQSKRIKDEEKRLAERRRSIEKNEKRMKDTLLDQMKLIDIPKIKTDKYTIWYQNNPMSLLVNDESNIPKRFYNEQKPKLDKKALLNELKASDEEIDGVEIRQTEGVRYR